MILKKHSLFQRCFSHKNKQKYLYNAKFTFCSQEKVSATSTTNEEPQLIYQSDFIKQMKHLKVISLSGGILSILIAPVIIHNSLDFTALRDASIPMRCCIAAPVSAFGVGTSILFHTFTKSICTKIYLYNNQDKVKLEFLSIWLQIIPIITDINNISLMKKQDLQARNLVIEDKQNNIEKPFYANLEKIDETFLKKIGATKKSINTPKDEQDDY